MKKKCLLFLVFISFSAAASDLELNGTMKKLHNGTYEVQLEEESHWHCGESYYGTAVADWGGNYFIHIKNDHDEYYYGSTTPKPTEKGTFYSMDLMDEYTNELATGTLEDITKP